MLSPNATNFEHGALNVINSQGFRDREYTVTKAPGVKRIIFLGDSVIYGDGIESHETVPERLEQIFGAEGKPIEVLNLGVAGYESEQEVELFKELGLQFKPDHVVVGYWLNDSNHGSGEILWFHTTLRRRIKTDRKPSPAKKAFQELKELSEKNSFDLTVVIFPIIQELERYPLKPLHEFLNAEFDGMGFHVIDLLDWAKKLSSHYERNDISKDSIHLTSFGAKSAADYLHQELDLTSLDIQ